MAGVVDPYIIVDQCLEWIGFGIPNQRAAISTKAGFNSLEDLNDIEEKDIRDMADSFQKRTITHRINFGMRRTKWLIAMMHWVQDFYRCSKQPTIDDFVTANDFKQALSTAAQRASLRKVDTDQVNTISKAADPGKLKDERKWPEWYPAFVNYLSTIPGVYGVPLSYVVRENQAPDHTRDFEGDFTEEIIACAPLNGPKFCYKLRMFGIPIEGPTNVFCDNEAVFKNTTIPESTLKKKHNSICYHRCREAVAAKVMRVAKEGMLTNLADLFTKPLVQSIREGLLDRFTD